MFAKQSDNNMSKELVSIAKYARLCGVASAAIYGRIFRGSLEAVEVALPDQRTQKFIDLKANPATRATQGKKRKGVANV